MSQVVLQPVEHDPFTTVDPSTGQSVFYIPGTSGPGEPVSHDPFAAAPIVEPSAISPTLQRRATAVQRRLDESQAPQIGSPEAVDPFVGHQIGQSFWPYAQSPEDVLTESLRRELDQSGIGMPGMGSAAATAAPAPAEPPAMPLWLDPTKQEASIGPQEPGWQKGLAETLKGIAPQGSGLAQVATAVPGFVQMTPAGAIADIGEGLQKGDPWAVAMAAGGLVPGVGPAERAALKGGKLAARLEAKALPSAAATLGESLGETAAPRLVPLLQQKNPFSATLAEMHPDELALTSNATLDPATAAIAARSRNVEDIAAELHKNSQDALRTLGVKGGRITGPDSTTDELIARSLAAEAKAAIDRGGITALDWYSKKFDNAMRIAAVMHPEIAADPHMATAYRAALAITSQGETVPANVRLADQVYARFKENGGRFPTDVVAKNGPAMNLNLRKFNDLLDALGPEETTNFLARKMKAGELAKLSGQDISGESVDTLVHGSSIFGPKIGGGFYQNLSGNYEPTTFDLWWMRNWGRKTGNLVGLVDSSKQRARLEAAIANAANEPNLPPEIQKIAAKGTPKTQPALLQRAEEIATAHEQDFTKNRALYDSGEQAKSTLAKAAIAYRDALNGINEKPSSGGQRNWMRAVVERAREILAEHGLHMTNADLQATLWYPEKDLYAKLGGKPSEGLNMDYARAHYDLARSKGVPDDRLQSALAGADR